MKTVEEIKEEIKILEESINHPTMERWSDVKIKYIGMKQALEWVLEDNKDADSEHI